MLRDAMGLIDLPILQADVIVVAVLILPLFLAIAVTADMKNRGQPGWIYGLLTYFAVPIGLVVWLIARHNHPKHRVDEP